MKKYLKMSVLALAIALLGSTNAEAQLYELSGLYGYQLGGRANYSGGTLRLDDGAEYSVNFGINVRSGVTVELTYESMKEELFIDDNLLYGRETRISDLKAEWFQLGVLRYVDKGQARPFIGMSMGMTVFSPSNTNTGLFDNNNLKSTEKFSFIAKGGVKYMFTENIGLRVQGELLVPVEWGGLYIGVGTGGSSAGASLGSTTIIGAFSGGLIIAFGEE